MRPYDDLNAYYGDLHNHCGISYGHGPLAAAFTNARLRLDFCSVTGHAHWPDMPESSPQVQPIIDFHLEGFEKLRRVWGDVLRQTREADEPGRFVLFPGFEMHSGEYGDVTIVYREIAGNLVYADSLPGLKTTLRKECGDANDAIVMPHHLGYRRGARGINWDGFTEAMSPLVEIVSMHGCSETDESPRPFLHTMGPLDGHSTVRRGLAMGRVFGLTGNTDHHSGHPGSYGHGMTGVWAPSLSRADLWEAFRARRTWAMTGDRIALRFALNGAPMGAAIDGGESARQIAIDVDAGGAIDYVDLVKNNRLLKRWSQTDVESAPIGETIRTKLFLEVGWGNREDEHAWDVDLGIDDGRIVAVEPRFRGADVVKPTDREKADAAEDFSPSSWRREGERTVHFNTVTRGNPNNFTPRMQGMCLEIEAPRSASVCARFDDREVAIPIERLIEGSKSGNLGPIDTPAWRFHRLPRPDELHWSLSLVDNEPERALGGRDVYYVRVRQRNDQWAWSSPIFVE